MHRNFLIIGQAPAMDGNPEEPLEGRIGKKLAAMFGCTYEEYLAMSQRFNILPEWPGRKGKKGDKFPKVIARINAQRMEYSFAWCTVLFLGIQVGRMFRFPGKPLKWARIPRPSGNFYQAAVLPHPSGINRWWNYQENKTHAVKFMQETMSLLSRSGG